MAALEERNFIFPVNSFLKNTFKLLESMLPENGHLFIFDVLIFFVELSDLLLLVLIHLELYGLSSSLKRKHNAFLNSLGNLVGNKVSILTVNIV